MRRRDFHRFREQMAAKPRNLRRTPRSGDSGTFGLERRHQPVLPTGQFVLRLGRWAGLALAVVVISLSVATCAYHYLESFSWLESFLNAAMILGGMGPVDPLKTDAGKIFASFYALYSGLAILSVAGLILAPVVHRFLHKFHVEDDSD
jgi:hypothetical protein